MKAAREASSAHATLMIAHSTALYWSAASHLVVACVGPQPWDDEGIDICIKSLVFLIDSGVAAHAQARMQ